MRILVTGFTGQVGKALTKRLCGLGDVVPADRSALNLAELRTLPARRVRYRLTVQASSPEKKPSVPGHGAHLIVRTSWVEAQRATVDTSFG